MENSFVSFQQQIIQLAEEKNYIEAIIQLESGKSRFPWKIDRIGQWKADVYCLLGEEEKALNELNEVLSKGLWWNPEILENDPELASLKSLPDYQNVIKKCDRLFQQEKQAAKPELNILGNPKADICIFSLHMRGSNAEDYISHWQDPVLKQNYFMAFPQSSQLFSWNCYTWDEQDKAHDEISQAYNEFARIYSTLNKQIIVAGASQGADAALTHCLANKEFNKFVLLIPSFQDTAKIEKLLQAHESKDIRGVIITGDQDPFYENVQRIHSLMKRQGLECQLIVKKNQGHLMPEDLPELLDQASLFVLHKN
ncbi:alpha/beta hydrolase [Halobacillus sp. A5]|uniref:alpha/beta hydrolase n=1 Tax=Halobacillus sp. A5 TaxID=2880263 RepID=UPI0020A63F7F|nr:hypothetical protein [Halobacillus sp. A5]MCP3028921.1 hypothetical protein [Halobacillus sp. A5]